MDKNSIFTNNGADVLRENVAELYGRAERSLEQIDISIELLVDRLYEQMGKDELDSIYAEVCASSLGLTIARKMLVCQRLCKLIGDADVVNEHGVFGEAELLDSAAEGRVAYVKNRRNDDAYLAFAKSIKGARAEYVSSFQDACEAAADGGCEYCIIPIENDADGKLYSFYRLLDRYGLKIHEITRASSEDGTQGIVFALVSASIKPYLRGKENKRFEFSVVGEGADFVCDVLSAVSAIGARLYSVATLPVRYDEKSCRCYFSADVEPKQLLPLALYLSLEFHGYTALGLYQAEK